MGSMASARITADYIVLTLGAVLVIVVGAMSLFIFKSILNPLSALQAEVGQFGGGKWSSRITIKSKDEVGELGAAFNTMAEEIEGNLESLTKAKRDLVEHKKHLEQKVVEFHPNHILAIAWVQDYRTDTDLKNEYSYSTDGGRSWNGPHPTAIQGQTMTPIWLGDDRFLVLYNKRYGHQKIQMCLVRISRGSWTVEFEGTMFDGHASLELTDNISSQEQIRLIKFGYPGGMRLDDETVLAVHWCEEDGICGIRWTRLRIT